MSHNDLPPENAAPPVGGAREVDWATISIAVPRELKHRFEAVADRLHLKASQYGRMVIADAVSRQESAALGLVAGVTDARE
jgi:predicted transcriptional regulator